MPGATRLERALPALSGALLALSFPPAALLLPPFVALVPLLLFIESLPPDDDGRWQATRGGLITGLLYFGIQLYWVAVALFDRSPLAIPAYLLLAGGLAALVAAFGWALHLTRRGPGLPLALRVAILWTAAEWVQGGLGDLAFPWLGLGTSLAPYPVLAGAADLVGARGLSFWIAAVNGLVATAILRHRTGKPIVPQLAVLTVALLAPVAYGVWRAETLELRPAARVAVVQPNVSTALRAQDAALDSATSRLTRLTLGLRTAESRIDRPDLVAWPEVALPVDLAAPWRGRRTGIPTASDTIVRAVLALSRTVHAPILTGAYGVEAGAGDEGDRHNSAFLLEGESGTASRYDKRRLVPFIERTPLVGGGLARGGDAEPLTTANGARFGVLICYESIFADLARDYRADGADFLVNITNDAWYGRDVWYGRTTGLWQHPAHLTLRAIETRAGIARAANTGISMFIDPIGRVYQATALFEQDARTAVVYTTAGTTLFVRWGDWLGTAAAVVALGLGFASRGGRG